MPDRPPFPIPEVIDPPKMCLQLCIPDDPTWKRVINGLLSELGQWYNWQRDDAKSGKELAQVWRKIYNDIDWSDMSCCSNCPPPRFRFGADGTYEISTDGGATWQPAPDYDYRNNSVLFPPLSAGGITNTKCQAADSVVVTINDKIVQDMTEGQGAAAILALIAAVLLVFLTAGSALVIASMPGIAGAILGVGIAATQAAFTSEVLSTFRCLVYNRMDTDDSISAESVQLLIQDVHDNFEGIVNIVLTNILNGSGSVGLTNMMRSNSGDPDADCEGCGPEYVRPYIQNATAGIEVSYEDNVLTATSTEQGGWQRIFIVFDPTHELNINMCAKACEYTFEPSEGDANCQFIQRCENPDLEVTGITIIKDTSMCRMVWQSTAPFTLHISCVTPASPNCE